MFYTQIIAAADPTVRNACRQDPLFADRLARAQQERDLYFVRRIQNAGEKSWRAAAWLLERVEPQEFSLQHKSRDPWTVRGQRRLKKLVTDIVKNAIADSQQSSNRNPSVNPALRMIEDRLAEIESQSIPYDDSDDEEPELEDTELQNDQPGERDGVSHPMTGDDLDGDDFDEKEPDEDFVENDGFQSEDAAVQFYRQALRKLNSTSDETANAKRVESYRQRLRKRNR
jgi:hypothetical protein